MRSGARSSSPSTSSNNGASARSAVWRAAHKDGVRRPGGFSAPNLCSNASGFTRCSGSNFDRFVMPSMSAKSGVTPISKSVFVVTSPTAMRRLTCGGIPSKAAAMATSGSFSGPEKRVPIGVFNSESSAGAIFRVDSRSDFSIHGWPSGSIPPFRMAEELMMPPSMPLRCITSMMFKGASPLVWRCSLMAWHMPMVSGVATIESALLCVGAGPKESSRACTVMAEADFVAAQSKMSHRRCSKSRTNIDFCSAIASVVIWTSTSIACL